MFGELFKKSKKSLVLTSAGVLAIAATANAYQADEHSYIIQGASSTTMIQLVQSVGGEVIQNIALTDGISASLTAQEVLLLQQKNSLLRFNDTSVDNKVAGFVWGKIGKKPPAAQESDLDNKVAGFVWGKIGKKPPAAQESDLDNKVAGFVWGKIGKKRPPAATQTELDNKVAGFVWGKIGKKPPAAEQANLDNKIAGFVWGKIGKKRPKKHRSQTDLTLV